MKLSEWARKNGIYYGTALRWFHSGTLPAPAKQLDSGTILVLPQENVNNEFLETYVYARVSSYEKKNDLLNQARLCEEYCISKGWQIKKTIKEVASGMNDNRPKLSKILEKRSVRLVCLHKDRLTRFGYHYLDHCVKANGGYIEVINPEKTDEDDLIKDFATIITSFCCRLYGARRGQSKALKMKESLV